MAKEDFGVDIDLNGNKLLQVGDPTANDDGANKLYVDKNDQNSTNSYAVASGTNSYTVSFTPALTSYVAGQFLKVLFTNGNSGASNINVDGLGFIPLVMFGGTALTGGEITNGQILTIAFDGTNFQVFSGIQGLTGSGSTVTVLKDNIPVAGTPHSRLNFTGPGVAVNNFGGGQADIFVSGCDRQEARSSALFQTTSQVYVDLTSMTLTTKNLAQIGLKANGNYEIFFNCQLSVSNNTSSGFFIINVNGLDIATMEASDTPGNTGKHNFTLIGLVNNLSPGNVIKIRTRIQPGGGGTPTLTVYERSLTIDGVNVNTIVT